MKAKKNLLKFYSMRWLKIPLIWVFLSFLFYLLFPHSGKDAILFLRFHSFLTLYACVVYVLFRSRSSCTRVILEGIGAISAGLLLVLFLIEPLPTSSLRSFFYTAKLWVFFLIYLAFLASWMRFLRSLLLGSHIASLLFLLWITLTLCNLFVLHWINSGHGIEFMLYLNPIVVLSTCFPGYDYLRGYFFYHVYPIASFLAPFRYPRFLPACLGYSAFSILLFLASNCFEKVRKMPNEPKCN